MTAPTRARPLGADLVDYPLTDALRNQTSVERVD